MNTEDLMMHLRHSCESRSQKVVAGELGISPQFLNDVLKGHRAPSQKLLAGMGLERTTSYTIIDSGKYRKAIRIG